jgi:hypothetical protein
MHIPLKDPKFTQIQSLSSIWSQPNSVIKDIWKNICTILSMEIPAILLTQDNKAMWPM